MVVATIPGDGAVMNVSRKPVPNLRSRSASSRMGAALTYSTADSAAGAFDDARRMREARGHLPVVARKLDLVARRRALRLAAEAAHAARHVGLKADTGLLAVVADIDAGFDLALDDMAGRSLDLARKRGRIDGSPRPPAGSTDRTAFRCAAGCRHGWSECDRCWSASGESSPVIGAVAARAACWHHVRTGSFRMETPRLKRGAAPDIPSPPPRRSGRDTPERCRCSAR